MLHPWLPKLLAGGPRGSHNGNHDRVAPAIRRQDDAVVSILDAGCDIVYVEGAESAADLEKVARAEFLAVR